MENPAGVAAIAWLWLVLWPVANLPFAVEVLDPRESHGGFFMGLMEKALFHYKDGDDPPPAPELLAAAAQVRRADAFVVVTPEMNHTIAPTLTNTMNHFGAPLFARKAAGIATYRCVDPTTPSKAPSPVTRGAC